MTWKIVGAIMSAIFVVLSLCLAAIFWPGRGSGTHAASTPLRVNTPIGHFAGVLSTFDGKNYVSYRAIPYAKPPVGALRFKPPQSLDTVRSYELTNNEAYKPSCWSSTKSSSDPKYNEDCLYLNVYVPGSGETAVGHSNLPVMVWIHGGGFVAGTAFPEPGKMVTRGNVIVVSVNYRLGVFGFLTTEDEALPGNNGLKDVCMAIQWVNDYIHFFHGDTSSITVFGESSGASSAALLAISPACSSMFHKVILQSGAATSFISRDAKQRALEFGVQVGCPYTTSSKFADCLRTVGINDLLVNSRPKSFNITTAQAQLDFIWMPVVDRQFIPDEPSKLLNNVTYLQQVGALRKDFLIGLLNNEGALLTTNFLNPINMSDTSNRTFLEDLTDYLLYSRYGRISKPRTHLKSAIYSFYTGSSSLGKTLRPQNALDLTSDAVFVVPALELAMVMARCHQVQDSCPLPAGRLASPVCAVASPAQVFLYHIDYCPPTQPCEAACTLHGADVAWEFPSRPITDPVENQLSDTFIDLLTTFSKTSNPGSVVSSGWPAFDLAAQAYLQLGPEPNVRHYLYDHRLTFWLETVPQINEVR